MLIHFSLIIAFSTLFIASVFDVKSEKGDVPEVLLYTGVVSGILLHAAYSLQIQDFTPLIASLAAGIGLTTYGYFAYIKGMWGGADMLGLSILGFSTGYFLGFAGLMDLLVNTVAVGFLYALGFGIIGGIKSEEVREDFYSNLIENKMYLAIFLSSGLVLGVYAQLEGLRGWAFFVLSSFMLLTYYYIQSVEDELMTKEVEASEVEVGDVLAEGEIKGVTEEELRDLEGTVKLKEGIRFMPVFPAGLLLTVAGISFLQLLFTLF